MNPLHQLSETIADIVHTTGNSLATLARGGTAIAWDDQGHFVTSAAAVRGRPQIGMLHNGARVRAKVVGKDPSTDIAVLHADLSTTPLEWADTPPRVGALVLITGRGRRGAYASLGTVSAVADAWRTPAGATVDHFIDVDGSLPRGFAGGPLIDASGAVVGINTRGLVRGGTTLPTKTVRRVVEALLEHGAVQRGYLGVGMQPVELPEPVDGHEAGLLLTWVDPNGPARAAGLYIGDVLVELGGAQVRDASDVAGQLPSDAIGTKLPAVWIRGGQAHSGEVEVTHRE